MEREQVISRVESILSRIGAQSMTMDHVARECGISKRTLYELFPDKRTLISEAVRYRHDAHKREIEEIFAQSTNNFEALMRVYLNVRRYYQRTSFAFIDDIKRLYPDIFDQYRKNQVDHVQNFASVITKAQQEGLVLPQLNTEVAAMIFFITMHNLNQREEFARFNVSKVELFDGAFLNFLRGIATIEGIHYIDDFLADQNLLSINKK